MSPLQNGCVLVAFLLYSLQLFAQPDVRLIKSTTSVAGGAMRSVDQRYTLRQTVAQPSLITQFRFGTKTLLQGFEHPFFFDQNNRANESALRLYPNPARGKFTVANCRESDADIQIEIFDLHGRSVFQQSIKPDAAGECHIEMTNAKSGTYHVRMSTAATRFNGLLIIL